MDTYIIFASTDKNKEVLSKCTELWDRIESMVDKIGDKPGECEKELDANTTSNKISKLHMLTVIVRFVFQEDNKYYRQVFLGEYLHEL